jgi:endonuclease YncB( thermonuclease family)
VALAAWLSEALQPSPVVAASTAATGTVERVVDGDTLRVSAEDGGSRTLRLLGVDAPESGQDGGAEARDFVAARVCGIRVRWQEHGTDRYGRSVASVEVEGQDLGLLLVRHGMAWRVRRYLEGQPADVVSAYDEAWREARGAGAGIWAGDPEPPWVWRRSHRPASGHSILCADHR